MLDAGTNGKLELSSLFHQMGSQNQNRGEDGVTWLLPELKRDRSEPVLEMRHQATIDAKEIGIVNTFPCSTRINDVASSQANMANSRWYVFFSQPNESSEFIKDMNSQSSSSEDEEFGDTSGLIDKKSGFEDVSGLKNIFSLSTEPSSVNVFRLCPMDEEKKDNFNKKGKKPKREKINWGYEPRSARTDMKMLQHRSIFQYVPSSKHQLVEQEQGPNKDFVLLDEYRSMKDNDMYNNDAIYELSTPLGNTVLHLAAGSGDDSTVEKVYYRAPRLFTAVNNNGDTALHVAARKGHGFIIKSLLYKFLLFVRSKTNGHDYKSMLEMMLMASLTLFRNKQGNTFLHEAFKTSSHNGAAIFKAFEDNFITERASEDTFITKSDLDQFKASFKKLVHHLAPFAVNMEGESLLYLTVEANCDQVAVQLMDFCIEGELKPQGKSPLLPALINNKPGMLETILSKKPNWAYMRNEQGWLPLHHAALLGCLQGVNYLVEEFPSCAMERDKNGSLPIHLACIQGHVKIVQELMKCCQDPAEMINGRGQNLLHVACSCRNYDLVRYLLEDPELGRMINQRDFKGNTPLHLATISCHPKIVHHMTWDNRVNLSLLNNEHQTALDIAEVSQDETVSLSERLTWNALVSAGTPRSSMRFYSHDGNKKNFNEPYTTATYKDRVDTLVVVSTLIITISFAAGFTFPGDVEKGIPVLLNRRMFHLFVTTLTISMFGAISSTIILMWARLGDLHLATFALAWAIPLLGLSITMLSLAFLAGMYLIVSKLCWLATTFLVIGVVLIIMVVFLYLLLLLPSSSTIPFFRYVSYYPFLFFAKIAEGKMDAKKMGSKAIIPVL